MLDRTALKFNQAAIIFFSLIGFVFNLPVLAAFVGLVMLVGTIAPDLGLFKQFYLRVLRPAGLLKPDRAQEDGKPHLFAQGVGAIFLLAATLAFLAGAPLVGWILTWVVIVLAAVNLFFGFCLGCFMYFQLARLGVKANLPSWESAGR